MWVLRLDIGGRPLAWATLETAVCYYARDQVIWEAGERSVDLHGGWNRLGERSVLTVNSIIATRGVNRSEIGYERTPALSNAGLFRRDRYLCLYCGQRFSARDLTRDHVVPRSRGGRDDWENVVSACKSCNQRKGNMSLAEAERRLGMRLLAVPYRPNRAEGLVLANRHILADQMAFLSNRLGRNSRIKYNL
ncbi:MAG: HNH endonuclease [Candidatus Competibacteraceae bacterium]|nr:HNH endonuclease [Candidatus Competibacteraceae bacterium]MCB1807793.1 HNH endonuclease [Candidatus Competibacteraceae bacterium]